MLYQVILCYIMLYQPRLSSLRAFGILEKPPSIPPCRPTSPPTMMMGGLVQPHHPTSRQHFSCLSPYLVKKKFRPWPVLRLRTPSLKADGLSPANPSMDAGTGMQETGLKRGLPPFLNPMPLPLHVLPRQPAEAGAYTITTAECPW